MSIIEEANKFRVATTVRKVENLKNLFPAYSRGYYGYYEGSAKKLIASIQNFLDSNGLKDAKIEISLEGYDSSLDAIQIKGEVPRPEEDIKKDIEMLKEKEANKKQLEQEAKEKKKEEEYQLLISLAKKFKKELK